MIPKFDGLTWLFPGLWVVGVWFFWLAASFIYSFLANGQTLPNKLNNARKYLGICAFLMSAVWVAQFFQPVSEFPRFWHAPTLGLFMWLVLEMGDWLAYWLHALKVHPGGGQGWFWSHVIVIFESHTAHARVKYAQTLDPAEEALQRHRVATLGEVHNGSTNGVTIETKNTVIVGDTGALADELRRSSHAGNPGRKK